jgi:uncharacterized protein (TIGR00369 family)
MEQTATRIWEEPVRGWYMQAADFLTKSGLDSLQSYFDGGRLPPPIHYLIGLLFTSAGPGTATFTLPVTDWLLSPQGVVSGSTLALLVDGPLGCAVQTAMAAATPYTTAEMSLWFVRPVLPGSGTLTGTGTLIHSGRKLALANANVTDAQGRLMAVSSTRCAVLPTMQIPPVLPETTRQVEPQWPSPHPYLRPVGGEVLPEDIWSSTSGLDVLRGHIAGELPAPPISRLCGIHPTAAEEGRTEWAMPASEWLCSPIEGQLYGGAIAYLAGTALDGAYQSIARAGTAIAPVDLKVYFLRPVRPDGHDMIAVGTITSRGRSMAVATSEAFDRNGKRIAVAIGSALLLPGRSATLRDSGELPA